MLTIHNTSFEHIKTRVHSAVDIYASVNSILRIGPEDIITSEANFGQKLHTLGFPSPRIISTGNYETRSYYEEERFLGKHLGQLFAESTQKEGSISPELFNQFSKIMQRFLQAQFEHIGTDIGPAQDFATGIQIDCLKRELPHLAHKIDRMFAVIQIHLGKFPICFHQGDCNPHNMFLQGVIDYDRGLYAPIGYDFITALYHIDALPPKGVAEFERKYGFSQAQKSQYLQMGDALFRAHHFSPLSQVQDDFIMARWSWLVVRMHNTPKLQTWRYAGFEILLDRYLQGKPIHDFMEHLPMLIGKL